MGLLTLFNNISKYNDTNLSGRGRIGSSKPLGLSIPVIMQCLIDGSLRNILNLFLVDSGSLGLGEKAILFRVLLSVAGFICTVFRMAIPFSAVRFLYFKPASVPDWGVQCWLCTECCSGTLRHHAKICHSEIGWGPFLLVSLAKISYKFHSYIALHSQCSSVDIPNATFRFSAS